MVREQPLPGPARVRTAEVTIQIHDTAGTARRGLGAGRNGQELLDDPMPQIAQHPQRLCIRDVEIVDQAAGLLLQTLAGLVQARGGVGGLRIGLELRLGQAQRIHGVRPLDEVGHQRQMIRVVQGVTHFRIEGVALGAAVRAKAIHGEMREVEVVGQRTLRA